MFLVLVSFSGGSGYINIDVDIAITKNIIYPIWRFKHVYIYMFYKDKINMYIRKCSYVCIYKNIYISILNLNKNKHENKFVVILDLFCTGLTFV